MDESPWSCRGTAGSTGRSNAEIPSQHSGPVRTPSDGSESTRRTRLPARSPVDTSPMIDAEVIPAKIGSSSASSSYSLSRTPRLLRSPITRCAVTSTISFTSSEKIPPLIFGRDFLVGGRGGRLSLPLFYRCFLKLVRFLVTATSRVTLSGRSKR